MHRLQSRPLLFGLGIALVVVVALATTLAVLNTTPDPTPTPTFSPSLSPMPTPTPSSTPSPTAEVTPSPTPEPTPSPTPEAVCPYTGLPSSDPDLLDGPAFLVQVENHPAGRPTSGFNSADMVVEAPVEGNVTRFTPVYHCGEPPAAIGPVRSARYYNADLWLELHGITTAYGAGGAIITEFARRGTPYIEGIRERWSFFHRRGSQPAPHNVYMDLAGARAVAESGAFGDRIERARQPRGPFEFDPNGSSGSGRPVSSVVIYTNSYWNFGWTWDGDRGVWLRSDDGVPSVDALDGRQLWSRSVVVQFVTQEILHRELDASGFPRTRQHLVASGTGIAYLGGQAVDVRWDRPTVGAPTTWTLADSGEALVLSPGRVWWAIVPVGSGVTER